MTGEHYQWWKRWHVDLSTCTATHDSGMVVQFRQDDDDKTAWDGQAVNAERWFEGMESTMPSDDLVEHATRLLREAGDAYLWQLNKRH